MADQQPQLPEHWHDGEPCPVPDAGCERLQSIGNPQDRESPHNAYDCPDPDCSPDAPCKPEIHQAWKEQWAVEAPKPESLLQVDPATVIGSKAAQMIEQGYEELWAENERLKAEAKWHEDARIAADEQVYRPLKAENERLREIAGHMANDLRFIRELYPDLATGGMVLAKWEALNKGI